MQITYKKGLIILSLLLILSISLSAVSASDTDINDINNIEEVYDSEIDNEYNDDYILNKNSEVSNDLVSSSSDIKIDTPSSINVNVDNGDVECNIVIRDNESNNISFNKSDLNLILNYDEYNYENSLNITEFSLNNNKISFNIYNYITNFTSTNLTIIYKNNTEYMATANVVLNPVIFAEIKILANESSTEFQNNYFVVQLVNSVTGKAVVGKTIYYQLVNSSMGIRWGYKTDENGKCNVSLDYIYSIGSGYIPVAKGYSLLITAGDNVIAIGKNCTINITPSKKPFKEDTFNYIQNLIFNASENDKINLNLTYYSTDGYPIIINKNITIIGNNTVLDAKNKSRIFDIEGDISVIFEGITFINGFSNTGRGIIYSHCSSIIFKDCSFINNSIEIYPYEEYNWEYDEYYYTYDDIGIIDAFYENEFIVTNCSFINNSGRLMNNTENISKIISAIYVSTKNGSILINNSYFDNNSGAINLYKCDEEYWIEYDETHYYVNDFYDYAKDFINETLGKILIKNCSFTSNNNAIYADSDNGMGFVEIKDCSFNEPKNSVVKYDNLIYSSIIIIDNCSVLNHKINASYNEGYGYLGGVIFAHRYAKVKNSLFINNSVNQGFGALFVYSDDGICEVENSVFINNIAMKGGAIAGYGDCYINNSLFENNTAIGYEGYSYIDGEKYFVNISGEGGAIFVRSVFVDNSTFINNNAFNGGAICLCINSYDEYEYKEDYEGYPEDYYEDGYEYECINIFASCDISGKITNSIFDCNKISGMGKDIYIDIIYENWISYDEMPTEFLYNNNLIVDNNFWGSNYGSQNEFKDSNLIVIGYTKDITFVEEYWNSEIEDYDYNYNEFKEVDYTNLAPDQWIILTINYLPITSSTFDLNLNFDTLNDGSKFNGILPNYSVNIFSDRGSFNSSTVLISKGLGFVKYYGVPGENQLVVCNFEGDTITSENIEISLKPTFTIIDNINACLYDTVSFVAKVASEKVINEGKVIFYVDGVKVGSSSVINGVATYSYTLNKIGNFLVKAYYCDALSYGNSEFVSNLIVKKALIVINPTILNTTYDSGKYFQVKAVNSKGKAVNGLKLTLKVYTGSSYKTVTITTNASGIAKYSASKLSIGNHKVIVSLSNTYYTASSKTSYIKVSKAPTLVTAKKVTYRKGAKKYFKVTVKNKATGKIVKSLAIKIKVYTGKKYKTYTVKTNTKGIAQLSTRYLKKGTHKVVISSGNSKYTVSKSGKLIVIK